LSVHTIDPSVDLTDQVVRAYLHTLDDKPVRYHDPHGAVVNTSACRGLVAWYVLIDHRPDALTVGAVRLGLHHGGLHTLRYLRPPAPIPHPDGRPGSGDAFAALLAVLVGMALDDVERGQREAAR
jgi:hypothetical protein